MKKVLCIVIVLSLFMTSSVGVFASNYSVDQQYYQFVGDIISETTHLSQVLDEVGLPLQEILELPMPKASFLNDAQQYAATDSGRSTIRPTSPTLLSQRIAYATKVADESVRRKPWLNLDPHMEVVYMYLSHYVDVRDPNDITSPVDFNSLGGTLAMYILPNDRQNYDIYMRKGSAGRAADSLIDVSQSLISLKGNIEKQKEILGTVGTLVSKGSKLAITWPGMGSDADSLKKNADTIFNSIKKNISSAESIESLIKLIDADLVLETINPKLKKDIIETVLGIAVSVAVSGGVGSILVGVMFGINQLQFYSKQFYDHVNWIALSSIRNMRIANRVWEYMEYGRRM